jgi:uncharacterized linocin/CFP29 family protein
MNHIQPIGLSPTVAMMNNGTNLGRDKLTWSQEIWKRLDQAIALEVDRTKVAAKFLPPFGPVGNVANVPADIIGAPPPAVPALVVNDSTVLIRELWVPFRLTKAQAEAEEQLGTAVTLATRAANMLAQGEDLIIFQGQQVIIPPPHPLFDPARGDSRVFYRDPPTDNGLLSLSTDPANPTTVIQVPVPPARPVAFAVPRVPPPLAPAVVAPPAPGYGENTFRAVVLGISELQSNGHYGPYALALPTPIYADTHAPIIAGTLVMPADRIRPLVTAGFYATGTLPINPPAPATTGILVSLGGNSMDLVCSVPPTAAYFQEDPVDGRHVFRVFERFVLRLKSFAAVAQLDFI